MLERLNPILRLACLALAALIVYQVSQLAFKRNALAHGSVSIAPIHLKEEKKETNSTAAATNTAAKTSTNAAPTNAVAQAIPEPPPEMSMPAEMSLPPGFSLPPGVTLPPGAMAAMRSSRSRAGGPSGPPVLTGAMMMRGGPGGGMPANLPPEIAAMVEKIKTSQILGPDIKPPPMALLGIAGKDVFLRAPNGQTGIIREGEELGGVKLIRVGTNRVIVEENKEQKELTIFNGFGSETLLKKDNK